MSYAGKSYQATWNYDPHGDTHNDRIGKILARGCDLRATLKEQAVIAAKTARAMELAEASQRGSAASTDQLQSGSGISSRPKPDGRGMVWVDPNGNSLGPVTTEPFQEPIKATSPLDNCNDVQLETAQMDSTQRSMHLWRKINPGCMRSTTVGHESRMKEDYSQREGLVGGIDKSQHRQKTEFTTYVEAKVKFAAKRF